VQFVRAHITSLLQLDALLLVFESGRQPRTARDVAAQMYVPEAAVAGWLDGFTDSGFCERSGDEYCLPDSAETYQMLSTVADCYVRRRISLGQLIFARPTTPAASFAEAFRIRKDS
jgi:hypothetical protein